MGAYEAYNVDTVNVSNGNVIITIPLYSLPEQGRLALSFNAISNNTAWQKQEDCSGILCNEFYVNVQATTVPPTFAAGSFPYSGPGAHAVGPAIVNTALPILAGPYDTIIPAPPFCSTCYPRRYSQYTVYDPDGASHNLYYDAANSASLRATDGSGYLLNTNASTPYPGFTAATIVSANGVRTALSNSAITQTDPASPTSSIALANGVYTDTLSRQIPDPMQLSGSSSTSGCPTSPNIVTQPTTGSVAWNVPGPNGGTAHYLICYTAVKIHTDFWGNQGQDTTIGSMEDVDHNFYETVGPAGAIQAIVLPSGDYWGFTYDSANTSAPPSDSAPYIAYGLLTGVHLPTGGSIAYTYQYEWVCGAANYGINTRTVTDTEGHSNTWTYDANNRVVTDPNGNDTLYTFVNIGPGSCATFQQSKTTYQGHWNASSPVVLTSTQTSYSSTIGPDNGAAPTGLANALVTSTTTSLNGAVSTTTTTSYDSGIFTADAPSCSFYSGAWCTQFSTGQIIGLSLGIPTSTTVTDYSGTSLRKTQTQYEWQTGSSPYLTANIINSPKTVTVYDGSNVQVAKTTMTYDENDSCGGPVKGNLTTTSHWNNLGADTEAHSTFNCGGKVELQEDGNHNLTTTSYDGTGIFVATVTQPSTNGVAHHDSYTWDPNTGNMLTHMDQNSVTTKLSYSDALGRLTLVQRAYGLSGFESDTTYSYPSLAEVDISSDLHATADGLLKSTADYDGLGRATRVVGPSGAVTRTAYDYFGKPCATSNPSYSDPGVLNCTPGQNPTLASPDGITYYVQDPLGRPNSVTHPDGASQRWSYNGNVTTTTDERGFQWRRTSDALDRLTQVVEPGTLTTTYSYLALGDLHCVDQWGTSTAGAPCTSGKSRSFVYDSLSRLITSSNPETGIVCYGLWSGGSPGSGTCGNGYDGNGNLLHKTDGSGIEVDYTYDALNRLSTKYSGFENASNYFYTYDQGTNGIGRLSQELNQYATYWILAGTQFQYDAMGRVTSTNWGRYGTYEWRPGMQVQYDLAGNTTQLTYPDGRVVSQTWDGAGRLASVNAGALGGGGNPYVSGIQHYPSGGVRSAAYGSGGAVTQTVLLNNRLQPCRESASTSILPSSPSGGNLMDRELFYAVPAETNCMMASQNNGNIQNVLEGVGLTTSQTFSYDSLNRLTSAFSANRPAASSYNQAYSIDSFGNMLLVDQMHTPLNYGVEASTNRLTLNGDTTTGDLRYNTNGTLAISPNGLGGSHTYIYTGEGYLRGIDGYGTGSYLYDSMGERTLAVHNNATWNEYVYLNGQPMADVDNNGVWEDLIYANGQKIAKVESSEARIHLSGSNCASCGAQYTLFSLPLPSYTLQTGDTLFASQYSAGSRGGLQIQLSGTSSYLVGVDSDGQNLLDDTVQNQWHHRKFSVPAADVGKSLVAGGLSVDSHTPAGAWNMYFRDIVIVQANGTVVPLYNAGTTLSLSATPTSGVTGATGVTETGTPLADQTEDVHYFLAGQVGTTQMELAAGGWPVWQGYFTPFGQEIVNGGEQIVPGTVAADGTTNRYKFTGKERDTESGLDYFGARYYGSSMGRWMSPDVVNVTEERMMNPSSTLNKYAYAANNPLKYIDPDGRDVTYFYDPGFPAGHAILFAYNQQTSDSAIESFGPVVSSPVYKGEAMFHMNTDMFPTAENLRDNYASITIQTTPEVAQEVISFIREHPDPSTWTEPWNVFGPNCSSEVQKILKQFKLTNSNSLWAGRTPKILWSTLLSQYNPTFAAFGVPPQQGRDDGNPRYNLGANGFDMYDLFWMTIKGSEEQGTVTTQQGDGVPCGGSTGNPCPN
ncbi:MAG: RHS repeat-associated core domain-containing protein [Acidobacteriota bacterium]